MDAEARVLAELSREGYASGEAISRKLNISRSAVWKHVVKLRERGYAVEASPRRGYRLASRPDKLLPAELAPLLDTAVIGRQIVHREEVASTADLARQLIERGAAEGTVVFAERQTAARGRMGRAWQTPAGQAIALSAILYPPFSPAQAPLLSLAVGLAAARAVESVTGERPLLKWPNDVYLNGRKLGGVLVEMAAELDRIRWAVASIGMNVNNSFKGTGLAGKATSLSLELGRKVSRRDLAAALLNQLDRVYGALLGEGFAWLPDAFAGLDQLRGKKVKVTLSGGEVTGIAGGVDELGRLQVKDAQGRTQAIFSGEATLSR
ncbi:MAG: biotin--[acetyl-CoA-carboxylase] ligase [Thermoleophilia bacterium]